jgi:cellulose synthase/poly-beta-1,6-N-acetylglucosamine synthase-like glycosyltransferase
MKNEKSSPAKPFYRKPFLTVVAEPVRVSLVIPTYNEENGLGITLRSLSDQTLPRSSYEMIMMDGGSKDKTRKVAARYADRALIQRRKGVGGALHPCSGRHRIPDWQFAQIGHPPLLPAITAPTQNGKRYLSPAYEL